MKHTTLSIKELECLEHLRNVGHFVSAMMQEQDCTNSPRPGATVAAYLRDLPDDRPARRRGRALQPPLVHRGGQRMKTPLPPVLRAALYRRAVACAWLTLCERQHRYPHLTLDALESAIAAELEGFYLRQHGEEKGRLIACALLEDLMQAGPLKAAPSLSFLGLAVMDELCARHLTSPVLH